MMHNQTQHDCHICGKKFRNKIYLRKHAAVHSEKLFCCEYCGKSYSVAGSLTVHLASSHNVGTSKCSFCTDKFSQPWKLRKHLCTIHPDQHCPDKPFICVRGKCYTTFAEENELEKHEREVHEENLKCKYCQHWFATTKKLRMHAYIHTGERPYSCTFCEKNFNNESNLMEHLRRHKNERPYNVQLVGLDFLGRRS